MTKILFILFFLFLMIVDIKIYLIYNLKNGNLKLKDLIIPILIGLVIFLFIIN